RCTAAIGAPRASACRKTVSSLFAHAGAMTISPIKIVAKYRMRVHGFGRYLTHAFEPARHARILGQNSPPRAGIERNDDVDAVRPC
ncbi:MAG: hypothetical protein WBW06_00560, partial [Xanthobacteraceae bacterium]